jgi:hypothetical protein
MPGVQIALSVATLIMSLTTATLVWRGTVGGTSQRETAARREEWWRRFQWASDLAVSEGEVQRQLGLTVMESQLESTLAGVDEKELAIAVLYVLTTSTDNETEEVGA